MLKKTGKTIPTQNFCLLMARVYENLIHSRACGFAHIPFAAPQAAQVDSSHNLSFEFLEDGRLFAALDRFCSTATLRSN